MTPAPSQPEPKPFSLDDRCKKCGDSLKRLMLLAMLQDAGAQCSPGPLECEHEF